MLSWSEKMQRNDKPLVYIDLFSGCGGLALGMHQAGWRALFAVEKNEDAFSTLRANLIDNKHHFLWPEWLPISEHDINELLIKYANELKGLAGKIPLIVGGPPCQGFSTAGRRNESDERNLLVDSYLRLIDIVQPDSVLFENVKGFTQQFKSKKEAKVGKNYSSYIVTELKNRGYEVRSKMVDFSQFGIPQRRVRFILFASKTLFPDDFFTNLEKNAGNFLKQKMLYKRVSIKSALSDLERVHGTCDCPDTKGFISGKYGKSCTNYQRYCRIGVRRDSIPDSHRFANHRPDTIKRFSKLLDVDIRDRNISWILNETYGIKKNCFSVFNPKLPAPTITSNPDDYVHYCEPRTLTVREYARIQSFPDWYVFRGKYTTGGQFRSTDVPRYTQIGNAIPPLFSEQMGTSLKFLFEGKK